MTKNEYELSRFEYIQRKIEFLDNNVHKFTTLFIQHVVIILTSIVAVFISWKKLEISVEEAHIAVYGLLIIFSILVVFLLFSIISTILSWKDYRNEEVELINSSVEEGLRKKPDFKNLYRWQEFWFIILVLIVSSFVWIVSTNFIIPHIKI